MKIHMISRKPATLEWSELPVIAINSRHWTQEVDIAAFAQICYDEVGLYVKMTAREAHIRAEHTGPLGSPCEDSCLEFFFCPISGDSRYFNFEFNPNGCMFLGMGTGIGDLVRLLPGQENLFQVQTKRVAGGWELSFCVPAEFIRRFFPDYSARSGNSIRANFYKCGDLTKQAHYFSWNPMTSETPAFHRPGDFGCLTFA